MKETIFQNWNRKTINIDNNLNPPTPESISNNIKKIHTLAVNECLTSYKPNPILRNTAPDINPSEQSLSRKTRRLLAQLRTDKSPILKAYLHEIDSKSCPSAACPLCNYHLHNTQHLLSFSPTQKNGRAISTLIYNIYIHTHIYIKYI